MGHSKYDGIRETESKRVKVYVLDQNEWKDTGTGFCVGKLGDSTGGEAPDTDDKEGKLAAYLVVSDEGSPDKTLLLSKLEGNIEYQRQEETLIVWKELSGQDIALSFEESTGCDALCDFIIYIQKTTESNISLVAVRSNDDGMGSVHEIITGPVNLPSNSTSQDEKLLMDALKILNENTAFEYLRTETVEFILKENYISTLIQVFNHAESKCALRQLLILSNIIKTLTLYSNRDILEQMVDDDHIMGVVGILEYDTEFPLSKANHREYLRNTGPHFREVVPLESDSMKKIIKETYRLQFLKDVVLVRFLDDHSFNLISHVIQDLQHCIIEFIQREPFLLKLMALFTGNNRLDTKRDGVRMLHQCVQITKNLEHSEKSRFFKALVRTGLFKILDFAFGIETDSGIRILATDMVISIIEHDILLINTVQNELVNQQEDSDESQQEGFIHDSAFVTQHTVSSDVSLLSILSKILLTDKNMGLKEQVVQALNTLLHPEGCMGAESDYNDSGNLDIVMNSSDGRGNGLGSDGLSDNMSFQMTEYFSNFYTQVAPLLFAPLINDTFGHTKDDILLNYLVKLISFIATEHDRRMSREFILENNILLNISKLMAPQYMLQLRLAVVRCLKGIVCLNDEYYHRHLISENLYDPLFQLLRENLNEDNMANSSLLDFFKIVSSQCLQAQELQSQDKRNFVALNKHLVKQYRKDLEAVDYVPFTKEMIRMCEEGEKVPGGLGTEAEMKLGNEGKRTYSELLEAGKVRDQNVDEEPTLTFKKAMEKVTFAPPPTSLEKEVLSSKE
ncbi:LADA_0G07030g1_1 [Lachancea dasiensis]|uniref:Serine/threonine-protein phosphatase 4 regulatory subunit 3 n=1 Tax=Lachancea dasiensis TaxID=1072105 RepID=A0A1G4JTF8_9SACH|nr:LADA_0G07030g1_1 [Lachancea dasiensis]